ncbi:MAG: threonine aldolase [Patulibacter sp.]|nr:threonine aldolase [Patulibacter sp.]
MSFASDNDAGVHPAALAAITAANVGAAPAYGGDEISMRLDERVRELLGVPARTLATLNGTGTNVMAVQLAAQPGDGVICAERSHLAVDEAGAPERVAGVKLLTVPTADGKLTPELAATRYERIGVVHAVRPRLVSVAQPTELGTVYTLDELRSLGDWAHERELLLHVDGARLANAAAALGVGLRELTADAGADLVSFGGTKGGLLGAEALVLLTPGLDETAERLRKQSLQLAAKTRFVSAQLLAYVEGDLWLRNAAHANAMARRLGDGVAAVPGVAIDQPVESNAVFATLPPGAADLLAQRRRVVRWDERRRLVRWMCAWDSRPEDVDRLAADVARACAELASSTSDAAPDRRIAPQR